MNNIKNVPKIRFKGYYDKNGNWIAFTHPWEQRKLSELSEKTFGGGTPKTSNESFWKGNIPWIQSSDLIEGSLFDVKPRKHISQEAVDKSATKLVPENSVAIVTRVGVGKLVFMPFSYATSQDFLSLSNLKTESQFTVYALYKKLQSELNAVQGTSIKGVTKDELLAKEVTIPCYEEQEKIGSYLHSLDNLITLHQRKCELHEKYVKYVEQKLMSGEMRFKTDDGSDFPDWEEKKLGECCDVLDSFRKPISKENRISGKYAYYGSTSIQDYIDDYLFDEPLVLLAEDAGPFDDFWNKAIAQFATGKFWVNNHAHVLRPHGNRKYFFYALEHKDIRMYINNPSRGKLNQEDMIRIPIQIPCLAEQQKIADCLSSGYAVVEQDKMIVDVLKKLKKCMLQKMFV